MNWLSPEILIALATLTFLEIVLGVDNIIFISILSSASFPRAASQDAAHRAAAGDGHAHPAPVLAGVGDQAEGAVVYRVRERICPAAT